MKRHFKFTTKDYVITIFLFNQEDVNNGYLSGLGFLDPDNSEGFIGKEFLGADWNLKKEYRVYIHKNVAKRKTSTELKQLAINVAVKDVIEMFGKLVEKGDSLCIQN